MSRTSSRVHVARIRPCHLRRFEWPRAELESANMKGLRIEFNPRPHRVRRLIERERERMRHYIFHIFRMWNEYFILTNLKNFS